MVCLQVSQPPVYSLWNFLKVAPDGATINFMNQELIDIIQKSTFTIESGRYIYSTVSHIENMGDHFMVAKDRDEITVVTKEENLANIELSEKNKDFWRLIALNISIPFYSVGFLAAVSDAMAREEMNVLIISTYSKNYILVRYDLIEKARRALIRLGFKEKHNEYIS